MEFGWDEIAVLEFFGVLPDESSEFGRNLTFDVLQDQLRLRFGVNVDTADCSVTLAASGVPLFEAVYLGSPGARVVNDKRGHFLEVGAPGSFEGRYDAEQPLSSGLRITLAPHILVMQFVA